MPFITITYPPKYPLTESEKKWLEERKHYGYPAACTRLNPTKSNRTNGDCHPICGLDYNWKDWECAPRPGKKDFQDAAEFEARVAAYMAKGPCYQCTDKPGPNARYCIGAWGREGAEACRLKHARLAVEAEMEAESARR